MTIGLVIEFIKLNYDCFVIVMGFRDLIFYLSGYIYFNDKIVLEVKMFNIWHTQLLNPAFITWQHWKLRG